MKWRPGCCSAKGSGNRGPSSLSTQPTTGTRGRPRDERIVRGRTRVEQAKCGVDGGGTNNGGPTACTSDPAASAPRQVGSGATATTTAAAASLSWPWEEASVEAHPRSVGRLGEAAAALSFDPHSRARTALRTPRARRGFREVQSRSIKVLFVSYFLCVCRGRLHQNRRSGTRFRAHLSPCVALFASILV